MAPPPARRRWSAARRDSARSGGRCRPVDSTASPMRVAVTNRISILPIRLTSYPAPRACQADAPRLRLARRNHSGEPWPTPHLRCSTTAASSPSADPTAALFCRASSPTMSTRSARDQARYAALLTAQGKYDRRACRGRSCPHQQADLVLLPPRGPACDLQRDGQRRLPLPQSARRDRGLVPYARHGLCRDRRLQLARHLRRRARPAAPATRRSRSPAAGQLSGTVQLGPCGASAASTSTCTQSLRPPPRPGRRRSHLPRRDGRPLRPARDGRRALELLPGASPACTGKGALQPNIVQGYTRPAGERQLPALPAAAHRRLQGAVHDRELRPVLGRRPERELQHHQLRHRRLRAGPAGQRRAAQQLRLQRDLQRNDRGRVIR